jgi:hypothetical protein
VSRRDDPRIADDQSASRAQFARQLAQPVDLARAKDDSRARLVVEWSHHQLRIADCGLFGGAGLARIRGGEVALESGILANSVTVGPLPAVPCNL